MASITPSNLYVQSAGSFKLSIASFDAANSGDIWESGITDVFSVIGSIGDSVGSNSGGGAQYSFTSTNGTIYMQGESASKFVAWVASGNGNDGI